MVHADGNVRNPSGRSVPLSITRPVPRGHRPHAWVLPSSARAGGFLHSHHGDLPICFSGHSGEEPVARTSVLALRKTGMRNGERGPWPASVLKWTRELLAAGRVCCQDVSTHLDDPGMVGGPLTTPAGPGGQGSEAVCGCPVASPILFGKARASSRLGEEARCGGLGKPRKSCGSREKERTKSFRELGGGKTVCRSLC